MYVYVVGFGKKMWNTNVKVKKSSTGPESS
jgi:hypothetical protein